jgi:hypothetical protein
MLLLLQPIYNLHHNGGCKFFPSWGFLIKTEGLIMKFIRHFAIAAIAVASLPAMAATDGVADATQSVGTYTNTFGGTPSPQLRVFGLQDAVMSVGAQSVSTSFGPFPGKADTFCVGHTNGASVILTFTSAGITAGDQTHNAATNNATGELIAYHQSVGLQSNLNALKNIFKGDNTFEVTTPQTSVTDCSNPNMYKAVLMGGAGDAPASGIYTDLVTVTARVK